MVHSELRRDFTYEDRLKIDNFSHSRIWKSSASHLKLSYRRKKLKLSDMLDFQIFIATFLESIQSSKNDATTSFKVLCLQKNRRKQRRFYKEKTKKIIKSKRCNHT